MFYSFGTSRQRLKFFLKRNGQCFLDSEIFYKALALILGPKENNRK